MAINPEVAIRLRPETLDQAVERLLDDRVRQGFPRTCSDPGIMAEIASAVRDTTGLRPGALEQRRLGAPADVDPARVEDWPPTHGGADLDVVDQQRQQCALPVERHGRPRLGQRSRLDAVQ